MRLGMAQFEGDPAVDREVLVVFAAFCVFYGVLCIPRFDRCRFLLPSPCTPNAQQRQRTLVHIVRARTRGLGRF